MPFTITSTDFNGETHNEEVANAMLALQRHQALQVTSGKIVVKDSGKRTISEAELMMLALKSDGKAK